MADRQWTRRSVLTAGGAALVGLAGCAQTPTNRAAGATDRTTTASVKRPATDAGRGAYARVYRETIDSVVMIEVETPRGRAEGTGFVYDAGHLLTNQHVVADADTVRVQFTDGGWQRVTVHATDVYSDLAVLAVPDRPANATPLSLLEVDPVIGERVAAIGNPFGYRSTITTGIVSGLHRSLTGPNGFPIPDVIQTDAAVNPGNSGGPLMTLDGSVAGVVDAVRRGSNDIGFAISTPLVRRVVPALVERGRYEHPFLGVRMVNLTPTVADAYGLSRSRGVVVVATVPGSPADGVLHGKTGTKTVDNQHVPVGGDVIVAIDGHETPTMAALSTYLALHGSPGETVPVTVLRDGERTTVEVTLGTRPSP